MAAIDTNLLLLGTTAVLWTGAGAGCLHASAGHSARRSTGIGLLVGAALLAFDGVTRSSGGLPLAGLALVAFAGLTTIGARLNGLAAAAVAAAVMFALHWAHVAAPVQTVVAWPQPWRPLDLAVAATLGWITWRGRRDASLPNDAQLLTGATAAGLAAAAFAGRYADAIAAGGMLVGALPMVFSAARQHTVAWCGSLATAFAVTLTTSLRATALHHGEATRLAGLDDPLLLLAALQTALGAALWLACTDRDRTQQEMPSKAAATETVTATTTTEVAAVTTPTEVADVEATADSGSSLVPARIVRELRTPLTNLVAAVDLAIAGNDRKAVDRLSEQLQAYAQQMTAAMGDFAELEHLLRGEIELAEDVFDLPQLLQNCVNDVAPAATEHDILLRLDVEPSAPRWIQGDPARVRQLVTRTIQLAVQTATIGPVDISVSADDESLHVVLLNHHATNTAPDSLGTLFATELARAMDGKLEHQLRASSGSQLHLTLPKRIAPDWEIELIEHDAETSQPSQDLPAAVQGTVLLITDNADHRKLLARLLGRFGAEVVTADSGTLGRHLITDSPCDLVLLDMQLHSEDPLAIVRGMRTEGSELPVLAISAESSPNELERMLAAGCNGHIQKPIDSELLHRALTMHLAPAN